jgi:hypothetical protein
MRALKIGMSTLALLISNIIIIFLAVWQRWDIGILFVVYWGQSVIIGVFNFIKIVKLKDFSYKGFRINKKPAEWWVQKYGKNFVKWYIAIFFAVHYGGFHLAYLAFIVGNTEIGLVGFLSALLGIGIFLVDHVYSYFRNKKNDQEKMAKQNLGIVMFWPYARIVPMHLGIVFGFFFIQNSAGLILFLILKTIADVIMHVVEHAHFRRKAKE